jgi:hypothetical protein
MPNPKPAKYTKQLGPMVTPELAAELEADAREDGESVSTFVRQMIEERVAERREARAARRTPAQRREWKRVYDAALAKTTQQGAEHVRRHRASDAAARVSLAKRTYG